MYKKRELLDLNEHRGRNVKLLTYTSLCTRHGTVSYIKRANAASVPKQASPHPIPLLICSATSRQKLKRIIPGSLFVVDSDAKFAARVTCAHAVTRCAAGRQTQLKNRGFRVHFNAIKLIDALRGRRRRRRIGISRILCGSRGKATVTMGEGKIFGVARHFGPLIDARVP